MYLMYVDESGDVGLEGSPTRYFVLSGLVVHELHWHSVYEKLIEFRRNLKAKWGIRLRDEIHASPLLAHPGELARIPKHERLAILRHYADLLASMPYVNIITVAVDKTSKTAGTDIFELAWKALIQRFENTLGNDNFPGPKGQKNMGMLFPDRSDEKKLNALMKKMRIYNPIPYRGNGGYRDAPIQFVIEDANFRDSGHSYFIQSIDVVAYLLYQHLTPSTYVRKKSANNFFARLDPVLCKVAAPRDPLGIVRL